MSKILQIGEGFIGGKLQQKLIDKGHFVEAIDLMTTGHNICDREAMMQKIVDQNWDAVILMAAISDLNLFEANPKLGMDVNIGGVINVAEACTESKTKLYFISTCCVYGNTPELPSNEESKCVPSEIYAEAKLAAEHIIKGFNKSFDLEYVILRIATCYGVGMRAALAPAVFINQALKGEPITIHGDGKQTRTLTYIDDEVDGIATVVDCGVTNETFNISTEEEVSVVQLARIILEELAIAGMVKEVFPFNFVQDRKGQTFTEKIDSGKVRNIRLWPKGRYCPDPTKAKRVAGWSAKVSLREGIRRTLKWMKENNMKEIV